MSFLSFFLQTPEASAGAAAGGSMIASLVPFALIIVIMYFLMIRPQNKKQKEMQKMLDALKKGDKVVTIGGIHGTVANVKEKVITVKVDDNCEMDFNRTAIASVVTDSTENAAPKTEKKSLFEKKEEKNSENNEKSE